MGEAVTVGGLVAVGLRVAVASVLLDGFTARSAVVVAEGLNGNRSGAALGDGRMRGGSNSPSVAVGEGTTVEVDEAGASAMPGAPAGSDPA